MKILMTLMMLAFLGGCSSHTHHHYSEGAQAKQDATDYDTYHKKACKNKKHAKICPMCHEK